MTGHDQTSGGGGPNVPESFTRQLASEDATSAIRSFGAFMAPRRQANVLASLAEVNSPSTSRGGSGAAVAQPPQRSRARGQEESGEDTDVGSEEPASYAADLFGDLKTNLVWDCTGRRLCLAARQYVETPRRLELKLKGLLDTASGQHRVRGHVRRNFYTHVPLLQRLLTAQSQRQSGGWVDEPNLDPEAFLPGGLRCLLFQDWSIAPGVSYDTARSLPPLPPSAASPSISSGGAAITAANVGAGSNAGLASLLGQRVRYQLAIKKNPQVIKNSSSADIWVQARALAEFDPKASEVSLGAALRLKAVKYGVTGGQDLRLSLGLDLTHDGAGRLTRMPYIHVSDGKLGAQLQNRRWQLTYTL